MVKKNNSHQSQGGNVVQMFECCPVDTCGKKAVRSAFCEKHFVWFKKGLVNRKGEKPKDFDKKHQIYLRHNQSVA